MKRRDFLKLSSGGLAYAGLSTYGVETYSILTEKSDVPPYDLEAHQPLKVVSKDGVLDFKLVAKYSNGKFTVNGTPLNVRSYNGKLPGYTWIARPGDTLKVRLVNKLPASPNDHDHPEDMNVPHGPNNTNLHTHGLHVSPLGNQDNILLETHPGEYFDYAIKIPEDHPAGTFWYHPHKHGSSMRQLASGMAGFLHIVGGPGDLNEIPEIATAKTIDIAFQELVLTPEGTVPDSINPVTDLFKFTANLQYTVNGLAVNEGADPLKGVPGTPPFIRMRPGEVQRWRFGTMCHLQTYRFALESHDFYVAAYDGITADEMTVYNETNGGLVMGPGSRVDILVKAIDKPGTYAFNMLQEQFGEFPLFVTPAFGVEKLPAFNVIVEGDPVNMDLPMSLNPPSVRLPPIQDNEIVRKRHIAFKVVGDVTFDFTATPLPKFISDDRQFFINNLKFSANRINQTFVLGQAEEWTITNIHESNNKSLTVNHPFHIHQNWFQVMEVHHPDGNGGFNVEVYNHGKGTWMDNIDVPHGGKAIVRMRFQEFPGIYVYHCHVLAHEDEGMMHLVEAVDPTPVKAVISAQGGGILASTDVLKRVSVKFRPGCYNEDTEVTYKFKLDPKHPVDNGLVGMERYFRILSKAELNKKAKITINFPLELPQGETYDPNTVRLYRSTGSGWTTDGISTVSLDPANGILVSTVTTLGNGFFAVLATMLTGPVTPASMTTGQAMDHEM